MHQRDDFGKSMQMSEYVICPVDGDGHRENYGDGVDERNLIAATMLMSNN